MNKYMLNKRKIILPVSVVPFFWLQIANLSGLKDFAF